MQARHRKNRIFGGIGSPHMNFQFLCSTPLPEPPPPFAVSMPSSALIHDAMVAGVDRKHSIS